MIPGSVSKLSEATVASAASITAKADIVTVTGTVAIGTIVPGLGTAVSQILFLVSTNASGVVLTTGGNILVGGTVTQNRMMILVWMKSLQKWVIGL